MPRKCTICPHPERSEMEREHLVDGKSVREISTARQVSKSALARHLEEHLPEALVKAQEAREVACADALMGQARELQERAHRIASNAEKSGDLRAALQGVRELTRVVELLAKLEGRVGSGASGQTTININVQEWNLALQVLDKHPEVKAEVVEALGGEP